MITPRSRVVPPQPDLTSASLASRVGHAVGKAASALAEAYRDACDRARALAASAWSKSGLPDLMVTQSLARSRPLPAPSPEAASRSKPDVPVQRETKHRDAAAGWSGQLKRLMTTRLFGSSTEASDRDRASTIQTKAQTALDDPALADMDLTKNQQATKLRYFIAAHADVIASPEFWQDNRAKMSVDDFGSMLGLAVIDRIRQGGRITPQDLSDFRRALEPFEQPSTSGASKPPPILEEDLVGPLDDDKLAKLTQALFDQYIAQDAPFGMNGDDRGPALDAQFATMSAEQKLKTIETTVLTVVNAQNRGPDALSGPLKTVASGTSSLTLGP